MRNVITKTDTRLFATSLNSWSRFQNKAQILLQDLLISKGWLFIIIGFLLGRAVILSVISPFALAFLGTIWTLDKRNGKKALLAIIAGSLTYSLQHGIWMTVMIFFFLFLISVFHKVQLQWKLPFIILLSTTTARVTQYLLAGEVTSYDWLILTVEGILAVILVLLFMQSVPMIEPDRFRLTLKNEEIVCMIILLASILTGTIGWVIFNAAIEQVLARYFVLIFAFVGGAAIGSTVGVVVGLILSLANVVNIFQMSLLAFSGLLGGLLKDGRKIGVSIGLLTGTFLVDIYGGTSTWSGTLTESLLAIFFFLLTPTALLLQLAKYIPGTEAYMKEQKNYLQKVRDVTARRVEQFSEVFQALAKSFADSDYLPVSEEQKKQETDYFLSQVTERTCQRCFMKEHCWQNNFDRTYEMMETMKNQLTAKKQINRQRLKQFENICVRSSRVVDVMKEEISFFDINKKLKQQMVDSKRIVADQLQGVSTIMDDFAKEIVKERNYHETQEIEIITTLEEMGLEIISLDIYRLERGNVDIELTLSVYDYHGEGRKIIAPLLSNLLNELIVVHSEKLSPFPNGYCHFTFRSAKEYIIETGAATAAKDGGFISGDSFTMMELGTGKFAMAISDGMGSGKRAQEESKETLRLLKQILQTGIAEEVAIKTINSILALRSTDEVFATLDLVVVNLHNAFARFLKIGSSPSLLKRAETIFQIESRNLPIGILQEVQVDIETKQLKVNDLLIMMSDGLLDGLLYVTNVDIWIRRKLTEIKTTDPQEVADLLLEEVIREQAGVIEDDMTILVAKVKKNTPEWASIPFYRKSAL